jgi:hypothetical protein
MERSRPKDEQPSDAMDAMTSHFDDVLVRRASGAIDAINAACSSIRQCRQQRIEAYLVRKDVHSSVCRLRSEVARARSLTQSAPHEFTWDS